MSASQNLKVTLTNVPTRTITAGGFAAEHQVIAFDNRGIGASSGAPATSIEQMAKDAITFIKAMGFEQVDLFGFLMGGMIAQEIALMEPQLHQDARRDPRRPSIPGATEGTLSEP